jgi:hypothetical protein
MQNRKVLFVVFLFLFGGFGYLRERFFEHLNIILASVYRGTNEYEIIHQELPSVLAPLMDWPYINLYYSKYLFTLIWVALFYFLSFFTIKYLTHLKKLVRLQMWTYLVLLVIASVSMIVGYLIQGNLKNDEYTFSRWLLGIAQSPIICLILIASEKLVLKTQQNDK